MMAFNFAPKAPFLTHALVILLVSSCFFIWVSQAASGGSMGGSSFSSGDSYSGGGSSYSSGDSFSYSYSSGSYGNSRHDSSSRAPPIDDESSLLGGIIFIAFFFILFGSLALVLYWSSFNHSVVMVQIGLLGKARSLQKELNQIARSTNTSSSTGWRHILRATTSSLVRDSHYFVSCRSLVEYFAQIEVAGKTFEHLAAKERAKFDIESLVNVNNVKIQREVIPKASKDGKDYIVVTILVATDGGCRIPRIESKDDLKNALKYLDSYVQDSHNLWGVEVLWTPQNEEDTLSEKELLENYPFLKPIS
ncbi:hypothetical protein Tsubulata_033524 [Turnera subulata]|uniref:Uncharacterized protein n=1 Tax=Turnera subulata TaxID=218843 RepID=A0A9Q0F7Y0_9ROSI|nr:hypothetical protein Tsubulata_033524 [Turnera subulata]